MLNNSYLKKIATLTSGVLVAQLFMIICIPVLTRLYTPQDYDNLAIFVGITLILSGIATGRFELAIPKYNSSKILTNLVFLCLISNFSFYLLLQIGFIFFIDDIPLYYQIIPITVFFIGLYNTLYYYNISKNLLVEVSKSRVIQVLNSNIISILFGFYSINFGLLIGHAANFFSGISVLCKKVLVDFKVSSPNFNGLYIVFKKNNNYLKYSTFEYVLQHGGYYLPLFIISSYSPMIVGAFFLITKVINIPLNLLGKSLSSVFYNELKNKKNSNKFKFIVKNITISFFLSTILIFLICLCVYLFSDTIFGDDWGFLKNIVWYFLPLGVFQFIYSSFSNVMYSLNLEKKLFQVNFLGFIIRTLPLFWVSGDNYILVYILSSIVFYILATIIIIYHSYFYRNDYE